MVGWLVVGVINMARTRNAHPEIFGEIVRTCRTTRKTVTRNVIEIMESLTNEDIRKIIQE